MFGDELHQIEFCAYLLCLHFHLLCTALIAAAKNDGLCLCFLVFDYYRPETAILAKCICFFCIFDSYFKLTLLSLHHSYFFLQSRVTSVDSGTLATALKN